MTQESDNEEEKEIESQSYNSQNSETNDNNLKKVSDQVKEGVYFNNNLETKSVSSAG
jgi:hypothetical protein